ncbi:MAG TPA: DEAD/DEAH box helicase [Alphaproteobacteria bacterium]|nr:DEAD/DEAH box helicase [Alphaproteobacteria bacterium]
MPDASVTPADAASPWIPKGLDLRRPGPTAVAMPPEGALALALTAWAAAAPSRSLLAVMHDEARADRLARAAQGFAPGLEVLALPPWDCLPYERSPPSRAVMGRRLAALTRLAAPADAARLVVTTADAVLQRLVPRTVHAAAGLTIRSGERLDAKALKGRLEALGYLIDERVDEPGEAALRGAVIDIFPGGAAMPCRLDLDDGRVAEIRWYDAATQRTADAIGMLAVPPVSEAFATPADGERWPGMEHWLPALYPHLETIFDYLPDGPVVLDAETDTDMEEREALIADAYATRLALRGAERLARREIRQPLPPDRLYLGAAGWTGGLAARPVIRLGPPDGADVALPATGGPRFTAETDPRGAFARHVAARLADGDRIVLAAPEARTLARLEAIAERHAGRAPGRAEDWAAAVAAPAGSVRSLRLDLAGGFSFPGTTVVAAADVDRRAGAARRVPAIEVDAPAIGDVVVHADHGIGILRGLETVETDGTAKDYLELEYTGGAKLMLPVEEIGRLWRYGSAEAKVPLDRLDGEAWDRRKAEVEADLAGTARELVRLARERARSRAVPIRPPKAAYRRFIARFPFTETADQAAAIRAVLDDLGAGRPMDRLVCGDVGFGKTEVALRAAAAAALAGRQVAVVAPTTVLARQHFDTFRRRFAGLEVRVGHLSRAVPEAEAGKTRSGLADGSIHVVIGTHALVSKKIRFKDLGLLVIDEEQRFGVRQKERLRATGRGVHTLTMTATPIPRTLQSALAGVQDLSIIATPPLRRQPIRTFVLPFDPVVVREALLREHRHGGQSFVVCPRIEDLKPMAARLRELVPDLDVATAHGRMPADRLDKTMVGFAGGSCDVLLSTNIVESGLDVPAANTMMVWRADRFGLAQLHQLRGRVGRGAVRASTYLLLEPGARIAPATERRLRTLEALETLGAGFAISVRDLDQRGAGDLMGADQAGHLRVIGTELYQHMLERALKAASGASVGEDWTPEIRTGLDARIPPDYVPEDEVRVQIYRRLSRLADAAEAEAYADEVEDRFGPPPAPVRRLLDLAVLCQRCRAAGIARAEAAPQAAAATLRDGGPGLGRLDPSIERRSDRLVRKLKAEESPLDGLTALVGAISSALS